eukprot:TRINITY_DN114339_c0_g1_i1.p1 TRINITY_DN114339_c0_g1~~TRINITY_DN114339_c0_g1_i1.p1  ORF type:complete len:444 (-),score=133.92 TRINITY_DN114339_c0_g1_i1:72-1403(-)
MTTGPILAEDELDPWDDWKPLEQTAMDFLMAKEAELCQAEGEDEDDDDDDDEWCPTQQGAAETDAAGDQEPGVPADAAEEAGEEDEDSDDDWAPQAQGAANVEQTEKEALKALLAPTHIANAGPLGGFESKKEADAAGRMLHEMKRPPTLEEAKAEIPRGPDVDPDLIEAPKYRDMSQEEAIELVRRGATVDYHGQHGRTPLHKACEAAMPVLAKALCDAGGDPDIRDQYGETPLLLLAKCGQWDEKIPRARRSETIQTLLSCGANVHAVNPRGRGVLHLACTEGDVEAIETLIEGMADVNAKDVAGFTPLMWAAGRNSAATVKMLLDYEADLSLKAARGQTAMTFALTNGCDAIVDILEKHQMILDAEEAKRIKEKGEGRGDEIEPDVDETLQLPKPDWACKAEKPAAVEPYTGRRVYAHAKPDRHSNVYVDDSRGAAGYPK